MSNQRNDNSGNELRVPVVDKKDSILSMESAVAEDSRKLFWLSTRKRVRFVTFMNMILLIAFLIWDYTYYPEHFIPLLIVRLVCIAVGVGILALTTLKNFWIWSQLCISGGYTFTGLAMVVIRVITSETEPSEAVLAVIIIVFTCIGLHFMASAIVGAILITGFIIAHSIFTPEMGINMLIGSVAVLVTAYAMGASGSYFDMIWAKRLFDHKMVKSMTRFDTRVDNIDALIAKWHSGVSWKLDFPNVSFERHFNQEFTRVTQNKRRLASLLSIAIQGVLSLIDELFLNRSMLSIILRYAVTTPFAVAAFALTFTRYRRKLNLGLYASIAMFLASTMSVAVSSSFFEDVTNLHLAQYRLSRFLLALYFGFIFTPLPYSVSFATGVTSIVIYIVILLVSGQGISVSIIMFTLTCLATGAFSSYNQEKQVRTAFLNTIPTRYSQKHSRSRHQGYEDEDDAEEEDGEVVQMNLMNAPEAEAHDDLNHPSEVLPGQVDNE